MQALTQVLIGAAIVALGGITVAVGLLAGEEEQFRYVQDVLQDPGAYASGTYTLIGSPAMLLNGSAQARHVALWQDGGSPRQSELLLSVGLPSGQGVTTWTAENRTRAPGSTDPDPTPVLSAWTVEGPHAAFLIHGFADEGGSAPTVWALYRGLLSEPLPPKPSQFTGRLATATPAGAPLPPGVLVFEVDSYKVGCSSKFLPPTLQEAADAP